MLTLSSRKGVWKLIRRVPIIINILSSTRQYTFREVWLAQQKSKSTLYSNLTTTYRAYTVSDITTGELTGFEPHPPTTRGPTILNLVLLDVKSFKLL